MRRRSDDWINATHILKVAEYDKPSRTRILEREVQKGTHEKVQGGYGKYQGTWIPLQDGKDLAAKNGVLEKLLPIFNFEPGDRSPPPAPKHLTAASSKPRLPKAVAAQKRAPLPAAPPPASIYHHPPMPDYDAMDASMHDPTPDDDTVASESQFADDYADLSYHTGGSRKRRRVEDTMTQADREHQLWADELLDYFMLQDNPLDQPSAPPPPANANINRAIDERGHTALHWAAAMGDIEVVKDLIRLGADIAVQSKNGETPLMRSVIFTNCFDKRVMERIASLLIRTVNMQEWFGSAVFHHIAGITQSKKKYECARYYMDCILNKMTESLTPSQIEGVLNVQDQNGDTAITIAARNGARKCVRSLIGRNAAVDIPNHAGETADQLIVQLNHRRQERNRAMSSSPFQADGPSAVGGAVQPPNGIPLDPLMQSTANGMGAGQDIYKSEAALTLTSGLLPEFIAKTRTLAQTLEAELAEKEAELAEAERLVTLRKAESEALKRQAEELRVRELEQTSGGSERDEDLIRELEELERECEGWVVEEEKMALAELLEAEKAKLPSPPSSARDAPNGSASRQEELLKEKLDLARQLVDAQRQRREHIARIVHYLGLAEDSAARRQEQYKRLITGALGVREEDVEGMLPEIVAELEEFRGMEGVGA